YRFVKQCLAERAQESKSMKKVTTHADLLITHLVFANIKNSGMNIYQDEFRTKDFDLFLPKVITTQIDEVHQYLTSNFPASTRLGVFFKNPKKCAALKATLV
ncbi:MAG: hypothetical protein AAFQ95_18405, partial [Cyanobacteria bacterium J06621_3]